MLHATVRSGGLWNATRGRSGPSRLAPSVIGLLALAAAAAIAAPPGGPVHGALPAGGSPGAGDLAGSTVKVLADSPSRLVLCRTLAPGVRETLEASLVPSTGESARQAMLRLTSGGETRFEARVRVEPESLAVDGTSEGIGFTFSISLLGDGKFRVRRTWDDGALAFDSGVLRRGIPDRAAARSWSAYRDAVSASPGFGAAARVREILEGAPDGPVRPLDAVAALGAHAVDGGVVSLGIKEYLQCLKETCTTCNACWEHIGMGCVGCPQDPLWAQMASTGCYLMFAEVCWFEMLNPFKGWGHS